MPCRPAPTPVNIVVQACGVSGWVVERSTPEAPCREQPIEVRNGAGRTQRLEHERGHRVEADDGEGGRSHTPKLSQAVCGPPSPTGWGLAERTPVQATRNPPVAWPESA